MMTADLKKQFKACCVEHDVTMGDKVREFIKAWIDEEAAKRKK